MVRFDAEEPSENSDRDYGHQRKGLIRRRGIGDSVIRNVVELNVCEVLIGHMPCGPIPMWLANSARSFSQAQPLEIVAINSLLATCSSRGLN
jgi:hypothetical protein